MLAQNALLKAIKYCGSKQKQLADLIGEDADKVSYWLNRAKQIPFHQAIAIEAVTNGLVSRYDLAPYARFQHKKQHICDLQTTSSIRLSDRVIAGILLEKQLGNRKGSRSDLLASQKGDKPGRKCDQVRGKTSQFAAKAVGFASKDTYLRAKKVVEKGIFNLVNAMDAQQLSISIAAAIADLPPEEQEQLLTQSKKNIMTIIQNYKTAKKPRAREVMDQASPTNALIQTMMTNSALLQAEKEHELPLRLPLLGLFSLCDEDWGFTWDVESLKHQIFPYVSVDFQKILTVLQTLGWILKNQAGARGFVVFQS